MAGRSTLLAASIAVASLMSCSKPAATPGTPAPCVLESAKEVRLGDDTELRVWNLRTFGLTRLSACLLLITDGKFQVVTEVEYRWEAGAGPSDGTVTLLIQDGKAFGAKGRLPLLSLDVEGAPPTLRTSTPRVLFSGDLHPRLTSSTAHSTQLNEHSILFAQLFASSSDAVSFSTLSKESPVESSRGGRTIVAVSLEWGR